MCLIVDNQKFRDFIKNLHRQSRHLFDVYKVARIDSQGNLSSPWRGTKIRLNKPLIADESPHFRQDITYGVVLEGGSIHCCIDEETADKINSWAPGSNKVLLRCRAHIYNIVAIGQFDTLQFPLTIALSSVVPLEIVKRF